jgi:hypothetical protein
MVDKVDDREARYNWQQGLKVAKEGDHVKIVYGPAWVTVKPAMEDLVFHVDVELAGQATGCWMLR